MTLRLSREAASYAIMGALTGVAAGSAITALLPRVAEDDFTQASLAVAGAQVVLNGVAVAFASKWLDPLGQDPTGGVLFTWALIETQPVLASRFKHIELKLTDMLSKTGATDTARQVALETALETNEPFSQTQRAGA